MIRRIKPRCEGVSGDPRRYGVGRRQRRCAKVRLAVHPAAQWTGAHKGPAFFAYSDNYLIDVKFGVIVDVEASRSIRQAEVGAAKTMIERTEERFGLKPERLVGDTAYGAAPMLNWLVEEKGIAPHIPVFDKSKRDDGTLSRSDFRYDPTSDVYHCPGGKQLGTSGTVHEGKTLLYRASKLDCDVCPLKPQCCPKDPSRKIPRDIHEHARDVARSLAETKAFEQLRRERKKIEMRFAHLKRILKLGRLRLRGPRGAQDEFVLAAIAQNCGGSHRWLRDRHPLGLSVLRSVIVA